MNRYTTDNIITNGRLSSSFAIVFIHVKKKELDKYKINKYTQTEHVLCDNIIIIISKLK